LIDRPKPTMGCSANGRRRRRRRRIEWMDEWINEKILQWVKGDWNILRTINRWYGKQICHMLRRDCLLKHGIEGKTEGKIEMTRRRGRRRRKQLLDYVKEIRG
jgi:hypothetical protein